MNHNVIEKIEQYLTDTQEFIDEMKSELDKKACGKSNWYDVYNIVMYYKNHIDYSIDKYEIYCRVLRDKIKNG
jgi:hypothetical protein